MNEDGTLTYVENKLLAYSEWLDSDQHLITPETDQDSRTHLDLVQEFLSK